MGVGASASPRDVYRAAMENMTRRSSWEIGVRLERGADPVGDVGPELLELGDGPEATCL